MVSQGPAAREAMLTPCGTGNVCGVRAVVPADAGWHIYAAVPSNSNYPVTTPKVALSVGIEQVTKWPIITEAIPATDQSGTT